MDYRYAVVTSAQEVYNYFSGERWRPRTGESDYERNIQDDSYIIRLSPSDEVYNVSIEAIDDASDRDDSDGPVSNPIDFIQKFLKSENFLKVSTLSSKITKKIMGMDHLLISTLIDQAISGFSNRSASTEDISGEAKKIGWEVEEMPNSDLEINIFDVYKATIKPAGIEWKYQFEVQGTDEATVHGTSADPIIKYREWYKSEKTISALRSVESQKSENKKKEDEIRDNQETVRPNRR